MAPVKGGKATVSMCEKCVQSKGKKARMEWLRDLKASDRDKDKYRWDRIVEYQKPKRDELAGKIRKIRDE